MRKHQEDRHRCPAHRQPSADPTNVTERHRRVAPGSVGPLLVAAGELAGLRGEGFQLALGLALLMCGTFISAPFYAPYMLKTLALGYDGYALLCAVQLEGSAIHGLPDIDLWRRD